MKNLINELSAELEALDFEETGKYQELSKRLEDL